MFILKNINFKEITNFEFSTSKLEMATIYLKSEDAKAQKQKEENPEQIEILELEKNISLYFIFIKNTFDVHEFWWPSFKNNEELEQMNIFRTKKEALTKKVNKVLEFYDDYAEMVNKAKKTIDSLSDEEIYLIEQDEYFNIYKGILLKNLELK